MVFTIIWAWWPYWSCDLDHLNILSFPHHMEAPHEIWLQSAQWFQRRRCLNVDLHTCIRMTGLPTYIISSLVSLRAESWKKLWHMWTKAQISQCIWPMSLLLAPYIIKTYFTSLLASPVSSASDCRSRSCVFEPQPRHIFVETDHEIISMAILPFCWFKMAVVSYRREYVHLVLVNRLGGQNLSRNSKSMVTNHLDMTLIVLTGP